MGTNNPSLLAHCTDLPAEQPQRRRSVRFLREACSISTRPAHILSYRIAGPYYFAYKINTPISTDARVKTHGRDGGARSLDFSATVLQPIKSLRPQPPGSPTSVRSGALTSSFTLDISLSSFTFGRIIKCSIYSYLRCIDRLEVKYIDGRIIVNER